jgi:hypothetical protein
MVSDTRGQKKTPYFAGPVFSLEFRKYQAHAYRISADSDLSFSAADFSISALMEAGASKVVLIFSSASISCICSSVFLVFTIGEYPIVLDNVGVYLMIF